MSICTDMTLKTFLLEKSMPFPPGYITHFNNSAASKDQIYPDSLKAILDLKDAQQAYNEISLWPGYESTPLHLLDTLANQLGVSRLWYKDEAERFGLGSFKALGGAYAVCLLLKKAIEAETGEIAASSDLMGQSYRQITSKITVSSATDGNHGRSVAWGAQLFGCQCVIYIHSQVSNGRQSAIESLGAEVVRIAGNYDDSVRRAASDASKHNRTLVSDTSYEGYTDIPRLVTFGYTVMLKEIVDQLEGKIPSHIFIQAGVGGLACAVSAYFWQIWATARPRMIIVEPEAANCLQQSARAGHSVAVKGDLETLMAGLACGEVSLLAWEVLSVGCDDFITLDEGSVAPCMKLLAAGEPRIVAGESAVAGIAALIGVMQSETLQNDLALRPESTVLVIGTEGATDPDLYAQLTGADR
jgi:diaminopropionate ammonia-lyase